MHHFFVNQEQIQGNSVRITGSDVNHIKNVLRMKEGEQLLISDGTGKDYLCRLLAASEEVLAEVLEVQESRELPSEIYLFQGLPKSDKMELIIQKSVELGVFRIIPVATRNAVVKLDAKKEESKRKRWQAISESAAKQSKRSIVPEIGGVISLKEAFQMVQDFDVKLIPYEHENGMAGTREELKRVKTGQKIAVFIGPEGGFDEGEIQMAKEMGVIPVSLGKRILRTETAGLCALSILGYHLEGK